jgi:hypothetical protein
MSQLRSEDDLRHDLSGSRKGRESLFWLMPLPDENLMLLVYVWLYADGSAGRFVIIGENDPKAAPVYGVQDGPTFVGDDLDKCSIGGLEIRLPELLRASELSYDTEQAGIDLRFEAIHGRTAVLDATRNSAVRLDFGNSPLLINEIGCHGTLDGRPVPVLYEIGSDGTYIRRLMKRAAGAGATSGRAGEPT